MPTAVDLHAWTDAGLPDLPGFALVFARVLGVTWPLTAWGAATLDARFRLLMALALAVVIAPVVATAGATVDPDLASLALATPVELARGLALGLSAALVAGAARQAGELIGMAAGLTPMLDPGPSAGSPDPDAPLTTTGGLYLLLAVGTFLALDGPVALTVGLVESYRAMPPGGSVGFEAASTGVAASASRAIADAIGLALRLAAPVALPIIAAQLAMGFVTRLAPVPPWSALAWPLRIALAAMLAFLALGATVAALESAWAALGVRG